MGGGRVGTFKGKGWGSPNVPVPLADATRRINNFYLLPFQTGTETRSNLRTQRRHLFAESQYVWSSVDGQGPGPGWSDGDYP